MSSKVKTANYYASDLNKFIDQRCSHQMDSINIDCLQIKVAKKRIRFIESKKGNEYMASSERRAFNILKYLLSKQSEWQIEFCTIWGDYPFKKAEVHVLGNPDSEPFELDQQELIKYLNFEEG